MFAVRERSSLHKWLRTGEHEHGGGVVCKLKRAWGNHGAALEYEYFLVSTSTVYPIFSYGMSSG